MYKKINNQIRKKLEEIVKGNIIYDKEKLQDYASDEFVLPSINQIPDVVVKPKTTEEVSAILRLANKAKIPVTPRGGGTGLCGGCVPLYKGIVVSLERMNKIIEIDKENMMAVVEAGVTLDEFYKEIEEKGLFFPPHPGEEVAQFGGLVNTNASGARAIKYGGIRNYVKGLEIVLPQGKIINLGGKYMKNSTGYNLLNLIIGSEGTLCIVTKVIVSLLPNPQAMFTIVVPYNNFKDAIETVPLVRNKIVPMTIEFIEHEVIPPTEKLLGKKWPTKGKVYLMITVDGINEEEIFKILEEIGNICMKHNADIKTLDELFVADTKKRQQNILQIRSKFYLALKPYMIEILDITVPPAKIVEYLSNVYEIARKYNVWLPNYGHAGDGNIHTHLMKVGIKNGEFYEIENWQDKYKIVRDELHKIAKQIGGIISGEHGIGLVKMGYLPLFIDTAQINLMKKIKKVFDPNNILNPGKIF